MPVPPGEYHFVRPISTSFRSLRLPPAFLTPPFDKTIEDARVARFPLDYLPHFESLSFTQTPTLGRKLPTVSTTRWEASEALADKYGAHRVVVVKPLPINTLCVPRVALSPQVDHLGLAKRHIPPRRAGDEDNLTTL